ncbi:MAG: M1 family peptidase [Chitinophagia bacterium]|nr:M1 family peptidase [Chitinophagia bacterium]
MTKKIAFFSIMWYLLLVNTTFAYNKADTLRGSNGNGRKWWDVLKYDLKVQFDLANKSIIGSNAIIFSIKSAIIDTIQIDLQQPLIADDVTVDGKKQTFYRDSNVIWVVGHFSNMEQGINHNIEVQYHGRPVRAVNPPWNGGFTYDYDDNQCSWVGVSCQGLGASVWYPCKDAQWDEPNNGMTITLCIPDSISSNYTKKLYKLSAISNGVLEKVVPATTLLDTNHHASKPKEGYSEWYWKVANPINNYDATFYIGNYVNIHDTMMGEKGLLAIDYWVLAGNKDKAIEHFKVVKPMLHCYEYWLGAYPFYEDGYKLVEAPYLGMEHQSAIAYGNKYKLGYKGYDRSHSEVGNTFDYIIIHESAHEWFGNNITAAENADNWIHEGLTTYTESLFVECANGVADATKFCKGEWQNIKNDKPIIGKYSVNDDGSSDKYDKGAALIFMIRKLINDDNKFRQMLRCH